MSGEQVRFADGFDRQERIAFGLGAPQLIAVALGALLAWWLLRSPGPPLLRDGAVVVVAATGAALGWGRWAERPLLTWAWLGARYLMSPRSGGGHGVHRMTDAADPGGLADGDARSPVAGHSEAPNGDPTAGVGPPSPPEPSRRDGEEDQPRTAAPAAASWEQWLHRPPSDLPRRPEEHPAPTAGEATDDLDTRTRAAVEEWLRGLGGGASPSASRRDPGDPRVAIGEASPAPGGRPVFVPAERDPLTGRALERNPSHLTSPPSAPAAGDGAGERSAAAADAASSPVDDADPAASAKAPRAPGLLRRLLAQARTSAPPARPSRRVSAVPAPTPGPAPHALAAGDGGRLGGPTTTEWAAGITVTRPRPAADPSHSVPIVDIDRPPIVLLPVPLDGARRRAAGVPSDDDDDGGHALRGSTSGEQDTGSPPGDAAADHEADAGPSVVIPLPCAHDDVLELDDGADLPLLEPHLRRDPAPTGAVEQAAAAVFVGATRRITFFSLNGGSGRTTIATEVACLLAARGRHRGAGDGPPQRLRVALVDLDLRSANVAVRLGIPQPTIWDLVLAGAEDQRHLDRYLVQHSSGLRALLGPPKPLSPKAAVEPALVAEVVHALERQATHFIVFDVGSSLDAVATWTLTAVHDIFVVITPTASGLQDAYRSTEALRRLGLGHKLHFVVNRARGGVDIDEVMGDLGGRVAATIPYDARLEDAENSHTVLSLHAHGGAAEALAALAASIYPPLDLPRRRPRLRLGLRRRAG